MKVAVMQPYLFPYLGYMQLMHAVDEFVLFDDVNYINKGWINRNRIALHGNDHTFTLPLEKASQNKRINEIQVRGDEKWRNKFLRTLEMAYKKAPNYIPVREMVEEILATPSKNLAHFIQLSLEKINAYIRIDTPLVLASEKYPNADLKAAERIIDVCKKAGATDYVNASGGKELYDKENFLKEGLQLHFLETMPYTYDQLGKTFIPHLSIIDILMTVYPEGVQELLQRYELS